MQCAWEAFSCFVIVFYIYVNLYSIHRDVRCAALYMAMSYARNFCSGVAYLIIICKWTVRVFEIRHRLLFGRFWV